MRRIMVRGLTAIALVIVCAIAPAPLLAQQGGTTRYVYDDNGRLRAVVSPTGEAALYEYDAAGNFTAIRRLSADTLTLLGFFPTEGGAGDQVTFIGTGFGAGVSSVSFNGANARIVEVSPSAVIAEVPNGATTGPVTITSPRGTLTTAPAVFTVVARVRVLPSSAQLLPGEGVAFTAVVGGGGDQSVTWSVNGVIGGNISIGTITATGFYTAPNLTGNASLSVTVRATSIAQPSLFGEASIRVINPNSLGAVFAPSVSVLRGLITGPSVSTAGALSVRYGNASGQGSAQSPGVAVRYGSPPGQGSATSPMVSVTAGPNISAISPSTITRGATATVTISGTNLGGATTLRFIDDNGALDTSIIASNLTPNADGSSLSATITAGGSAALGQRVVVVSTAAGSSLAVSTGSNTISISQ